MYNVSIVVSIKNLFLYQIADKTTDDIRSLNGKIQKLSTQPTIRKGIRHCKQNLITLSSVLEQDRKLSSVLHYYRIL